MALNLSANYWLIEQRIMASTIERFNRTYRTEVLDCYVFETLEEVKHMTEEWRQRYNHERPHESLDRLPPIQFAMAKSQ